MILCLFYLHIIETYDSTDSHIDKPTQVFMHVAEAVFAVGQLGVFIYLGSYSVKQLRSKLQASLRFLSMLSLFASFIFVFLDIFNPWNKNSPNNDFWVYILAAAYIDSESICLFTMVNYL